MAGRFAVAMYTMGSFNGWCTDPGPRDEAQAFIDNPPEVYALRPQDDFVVFELDDAGMVAADQAAGVPS